jgi:hypothetical protein
MSPPVTCTCGTCQRCRERARQRELRAGVDRYRVCAADGCENTFYATRADKRFCSARCSSREGQRRFNKTAKAREARKRRDPARMAEYHAKWYATRGKAIRAAYKQDRQKIKAHNAVARALRNGLLKRQPCEVCGEVRVDAHHPDYDRPLDVRWLCRAHHAALHAQEVVVSQKL